MTEDDWERLLFDSPELHDKVVVRRVGDVWRVAQPMGVSCVGRQTRWLCHFENFESALTYVRTGVFA
ncbi:hypothetical protein RDE2_41650 [Rhodococcus sp. RDE2]|nr:hypothetical protein RDE2_41650 [Rhodococcus sp. RDE2]